jgi:hypothetical protein
MSTFKKKQWVDCGYITISKSGKVLSIVVKHERYVANLDEISQVLDGTKNYTLVFEHCVQRGANQGGARRMIEHVGEQ